MLAKGPTGGPRACDLCGEHSAYLSYERQRFPYGAGPEQVLLETEVPVWTCRSCGEQLMGDEAEEARHEAVCRYLGRLTPKEIRKVRQQHGLSQEELAELTGYGSASIKRWESGALVQNQSADRFMRLLGYSDNVTRLRRMRSKGEGRTATHVFRTHLSDATRRLATLFELCPGSEFVEDLP